MAQTLNFTSKRGDTFKAVTFQININEIPLDLTDGEVKMQLRKQAGGEIALQPELTIFNAYLLKTERFSLRVIVNPVIIG